MTLLPPSQTPLNQHSLSALESWLQYLGAEKSSVDPCKWNLSTSYWSAEIDFLQDELVVVWSQYGQRSQCCFSYALARKDVEAAISEGP